MTNPSIDDSTNEPTAEPAPEWITQAEQTEFAPRQRQSLGKATLGLVALVVLAVGVVGGILFQKHLDDGKASASNRQDAFRQFPASNGELPPFGQQRGTGNGQDGIGQDGARPGGGRFSPIASGTVSSVGEKTIVVKNSDGKNLTITVTDTTTVTGRLGETDLAVGQTVVVLGADEDGTLTANNIAIRS